LELLRKMRGDGASPPPRSSLAAILATALAAAGVVGGLTYLSSAYGVLLLLGSFAASCLIVFAYPDSPFAQPRNVILGHLIGSACGLAAAHLPAGGWWAPAIAVGAAIALMKLTRTVHPPACSNPLIVFALGQAGWGFLLFPTLAGAAAIVAVALVYHNLRREARWPKYWF
jgi:CBS-domain-containing membrane protein